MSTLATIVNTLETVSQGETAIANNIRGANNPYYASQDATVTEDSWFRGEGGIMYTTGVKLRVEDASDAALDAQITSRGGTLQSLKARVRYNRLAMRNLDVSVLDPNNPDKQGFLQTVNNFFKRCNDWAVNPEKTADQQEFYNASKRLVKEFNSIPQDLEKVKEDIDLDLTTRTGDINAKLRTIASLNSKIGVAELGGNARALSARRERVRLLTELQELVDVKVTYDQSDNDRMTLSVTLADDSSYTLIDGNEVSSELKFDGGALQPVVDDSEAVKISSGWFHGAQVVRDENIKALQDKLDALAKQMVSAVNKAYNPTDDTDGYFFNPTGETATTMAIDPQLTSGADLKATDTGDPGDNNIALKVLELQNKTFATSGGDTINGSLSGYLNMTASEFGQQIKETEQSEGDTKEIFDALWNQRIRDTGTNFNEIARQIMMMQITKQALTKMTFMLKETADEFVKR